MIQTALCKEILKKANEVKDGFHCANLSASHIAVAVADFCAIPYTGLTPLALQSATRFEEERLRYLFSKIVRVASFFKVKLSHNIKEGINEKQFDPGCDWLATKKENDLLSADLLFLCAIKELDPSYTPAVKLVISDENLLALLQDTDKNIYDYVIDKIEDLCSKLKKKSEEAKAIRDWKPAAKFAEPEELLNQFFNKIKTTCENNVLKLTIPEFLRGTDLKLSIYRTGDCYIVHDNCCAVKCLSKRIDDIKLQKVLNLIWGKFNLDENQLFAEFSNPRSVLYFIQEVILTANADLYYEYFREKTFQPRRYIDPCTEFSHEQSAKAFDTTAFLEALKETVTADYDENKGLTLRFDTKYCNCSYGIKVLIETLDDKTLRFSDAYKNKQYETGEMLEAFYFGSSKEYDDMYYQVIQQLASPFGMAIDMTSNIIFPEYRGCPHNHKNPYLISTVDHWVEDFYNFMNSAVLISVVVDRIHYEKTREW